MSGIEWLRTFSFLLLHTDQSSLTTDPESIENDSANSYAYKALEVKNISLIQPLFAQKPATSPSYEQFTKLQLYRIYISAFHISNNLQASS